MDDILGLAGVIQNVFGRGVEWPGEIVVEFRKRILVSASHSANEHRVGFGALLRQIDIARGGHSKGVVRSRRCEIQVPPRKGVR